MWQDAIVQETRQRREVFASQYGHDPDAIFQAILQRQSLSHRAKASYATHTPMMFAAQPVAPGKHRRRRVPGLSRWASE